MKKIFAISLAVIGGVIGFIFGMTITFAMNSNSSLVLIGLAIIFAIIGGIGLVRMAPYLNAVDASIQKALVVLCALIAIILLLFLVVTIVMLQSYYQLY